MKNNLILDTREEPVPDDDEVTDLAVDEQSFSLKEFILVEKAVVEEDYQKQRIIVDLRASINTELTEIVDAPVAMNSFELEKAKISLEKGGHML